MSVGRMRRLRLYLTIQLYSVTAQQGPPVHLANRGGFGELGFLPGLLGIAHGIAHGIAYGIADIPGTTGSVRNTGTKVCETGATAQSRGRALSGLYPKERAASRGTRPTSRKGKRRVASRGARLTSRKRAPHPHGEGPAVFPYTYLHLLLRNAPLLTK